MKADSVKESTGVRLEKSLRATLRDLAAERRWTLSGYIEWVLEQHVDSIRSTKAKSPRPVKKP